MAANGPSRVAVVGPGAIGLTFAAAVAEAKHELVICGRRPLGEAVVDLQGGRKIHLEAPIVIRPEDAGGVCDVVLLAVKAHQTEGAARWLRTLCGPTTTVVVLQNGVEHDATVKPLVGDASVLPVAVWCPAELVGPGQVFVPGAARLITSAGTEGQRLVDLLAGTFAEVDLAEDLDAVLWAKAIPIAVVGLTVLAGKAGGIFDREDMADLGLAYAHECAAVARGAGAAVPDSVVEGVVPLLAGTGELKTSMLVDMEAGRPLEWDVRNGVIRRLGVRHGIPTPISDVIVPLLAAASDGA